MPAGALKQTPEPGPSTSAHGMPTPDSRWLQSGQQIDGRYRLVRPCRVESVWLIADQQDRPFAAKFGEPVQIDHEYRTLTALEHPGIVRVVERCDVRDLGCLVLEYLSGGDLVSLAGLAPRHWLDALREVVATVGWIHAKGVVHRDIKARNVMFDGRDRPRLIDFGSSRCIGSEFSSAGTTVVMPTRGQGPVTAGDDVYALAALIYELIHGEPPAARPPIGRAEPATALAAFVDGILWAPASGLLPDLRSLGAVIESALADEETEL